MYFLYSMYYDLLYTIVHVYNTIAYLAISILYTIVLCDIQYVYLPQVNACKLCQQTDLELFSLLLYLGFLCLPKFFIQRDKTVD